MLDKAVEAERTGTEAQRRRSASLRDEALEYLVVVFTEDRSISAKEVFDFLASIGGEQYSRDVMIKVAESYGGAGRVGAQQRGVPVPDQDGSGVDQGRRVPARHHRELEQRARRRAARRRRSRSCSMATAPTRRGRRRRRTARRSTRSLDDHRGARPRHRDEHPRRGAAPREVPKLPRRPSASQAVGTELLGSTRGRRRVRGLPRRVRRGQGGRPSSAIELRYYRADILFFKLGKTEEAGDEYLAVGKSAPVGKFHKDALLNAMNAFEKARPEGHRRPAPSSTPSTRSSARRSTSTRRCSRPTPTLVGVHLQERPDVLRLRRVRRGDQTLRRDRHEVPEGSQRGSRRRPHPVGAQQGAGLREHRELGAQAQEGAVVRGQGPAGAPRRG